MPGLAMSMVGKLLEEVSWEHATSYRQGGRGRENVLSAEVMMALDFLPRDRFLGAAIRAAKGADHARNVLVNRDRRSRTSIPARGYDARPEPVRK